MTKEERKEYNRKYYQANKKKIKEYKKQYYQNNAERFKEYQKQYNKDNAQQIKEQKKQYNQTPMGRALTLLNRYNQSDKEYNRGKGDLTAKWIVENIFSQPCHYNCGESDWKKMGCDRIDNSKPHTPDNVVPCCAECNIKRGLKTYEEFYNL